MTDSIIKGTGNSRLLKTTADLPATYEAFRSLFIASGIPVDLGNLLAAGCQQIGTAYSKANNLSDATEKAIWGSAANRTPDAALNKLRSLITTAQTTANGRAQIAYGTYTGTGEWGPDHPNSLTFPFVPIIAMMPTLANHGSGESVNWLITWETLTTNYESRAGFYSVSNYGTIPNGYGKKSSDERTITWYAQYAGSNASTNAASQQLNYNGTKYYYLAIG